MIVAVAEVVAVQGPSGCSKTTLLNLVGGIDRPKAGRIEVGGTNIVDCTDADLVKYRRSEVGFVFRLFNLVLP
jgi:putative ABC transport system ATP-binding protein